ncbi:MAG TPA: type IX secretion system membrane protein PorP/SprF [Chitinophagales bacterium]|nr:type IX secretion system membrane protein PorP/SprF [Chitinophagales bacterium]
MKKLLVIVVFLGSLLCACTPAHAQQDAMYSMYMFNGLAVNPAYAGSRERPVITALYRHQWTGLEGAPKTAVLAGHAPLLNDKVGLGMTLVSDNLSIFNTVTVMGSYAYRLRVGKSGRLSLGVNVEVNNFRAKWQDLNLTDTQDPTFILARKNVVSPNFGAGIYYYSDRFYAGFSVPHFLNMSLTEHFKAEGTNMVARQWKHYFYTIGAVFRLSDNVKFKPSLLFKHVKNAPFQADINAAFLFREALWVGASYRTGDAVVFVTEYNFSKGIRIGYAYDFTLSELSNYSSGTHEIMIGYEFMKKDAYLSPRRMSYF